MEIFLSFKGLLYEIRLIGFDLCKIFEDNLEVDLVGYDETCAYLILKFGFLTKVVILETRDTSNQEIFILLFWLFESAKGKTFLLNSCLKVADKETSSK